MTHVIDTGGEGVFEGELPSQASTEIDGDFFDPQLRAQLNAAAQARHLPWPFVGDHDSLPID